MIDRYPVTEIYKQMSVLSRKVQLYHWHLHGGAEVNLLLERDGTLCAVRLLGPGGRNGTL